MTQTDQTLREFAEQVERAADDNWEWNRDVPFAHLVDADGHHTVVGLAVDGKPWDALVALRAGEQFGPVRRLAVVFEAWAVARSSEDELPTSPSSEADRIEVRQVLAVDSDGGVVGLVRVRDSDEVSVLDDMGGRAVDALRAVVA